jgi:hypothetical protein
MGERVQRDRPRAAAQKQVEAIVDSFGPTPELRRQVLFWLDSKNFFAWRGMGREQRGRGRPSTPGAWAMGHACCKAWEVLAGAHPPVTKPEHGVASGASPAFHALVEATFAANGLPNWKRYAYELPRLRKKKTRAQAEPRISAPTPTDAFVTIGGSVSTVTAQDQWNITRSRTTSAPAPTPRRRHRANRRLPPTAP